MDIRNNVLGLGHLGLPSKDVDTTAAFFTQFGFEIDWKGRPDQAVFLRKGSCYIEIYKDDNAALTDGSWQHVALKVSDIEKEYEYARSLGYQALEGKICTNDCYEHGVTYFTVLGPDHERVEFWKKL